MRERWPLPSLGGHAEIRNLTPHAITIGEFTIRPSGMITRAVEEINDQPAIFLYPDPTGDPIARCEIAIPTTTTRYTDVIDLPAPQPGVYLVVSMVVPPVAEARGRWTGDLLIPGQQVRDGAGRIVGCQSLVRYVP